jgi:chitodextrinase
MRSFIALIYMIALAACGGGGGNSAPAGSTDTTPPTQPGKPTATVQGTSTVDLAWAASTDVGGTGVQEYRVFRDGNRIATATATNYTDAALTANTTYSFHVIAVDVAGNQSIASDPVTATTAATAVVGLDSRPSNTTCLAGARPGGTDTASAQRVFPSLSFSSPILALQAPGDSGHWFVVQQTGQVRRFVNNAGTSTSTSVIDLSSGFGLVSGGEQGLLGMAFHPNFPTDKRVFLSYTANASSSVSRISSCFSQ